MSSTVRLHPLPPGTAFVRSLIAHVVSEGRPDAAAAFADANFRSTPQVKEFFASGGFLHRKTAVHAGTTAATHYAGDMTPYASADGMALLQSRSIFGRLAAACRRVPFHTLTPREYGGGAGGAWRGEGLPRPLMQTTVDQLQQEFFEASTCVVVTRDWFRLGAMYESALLEMVGQALAAFVDGQLLDPSVVSSSAHPSAITNGADVVTSTGTTAGQITTDLAALIETLTTPGDSLFWILRPRTYARICAVLAGGGCPTTPGYLIGLPVILGSTSPQQITLVDAASILVSYDDAIATDINMTTSIEMQTGPTQDATNGTGAQMVSMYQTRSVAIKATHNVAWQPAAVSAGSPSKPAGVSYMTITY